MMEGNEMTDKENNTAHGGYDVCKVYGHDESIISITGEDTFSYCNRCQRVQKKGWIPSTMEELKKVHKNFAERIGM